MRTVNTRVDGVEYEYTQVQGYLTRGKVKRMIQREGWEVVNYTPVIAGGFNLKQGIYTLRKPTK
jgi:hypothetical protein